eukprot:jgi/Tetstr1/420492/TSEL_011605.t1
MVERCTRTQLAYASVEENTLQNRLTDEDMRGEYIHLPGGWTPTQSSNPALYRSLRHAWHWHTLLDVGADALAQYKLFLLDQPDLDGDIVDADTRLTYLRGSDSVWLQGAEDMLEIAAKQAAVLVEHDDDGAMEPLLAGAHAEQFPLFQLMRLTARVVQEALTHTWIQTDRFSRFLSDITKEAHKWETDRAAIPGSTHHVGSFLPYAPLTWTATSPPRLAHMEPIHKWREGYFPTGPGARPASVAHCDASDPAVCSDVQRCAGGSSDQWPALGQSFGPLSPASWGQVSSAAAQRAVQIQQAASAEQMSQMVAEMRTIAHDAATAATRAVVQELRQPSLSPKPDPCDTAHHAATSAPAPAMVPAPMPPPLSPGSLGDDLGALHVAAPRQLGAHDLGRSLKTALSQFSTTDSWPIYRDDFLAHLTTVNPVVMYSTLLYFVLREPTKERRTGD